MFFIFVLDFSRFSALTLAFYPIFRSGWDGGISSISIAYQLKSGFCRDTFQSGKLRNNLYFLKEIDNYSSIATQQCSAAHIFHKMIFSPKNIFSTAKYVRVLQSGTNLFCLFYSVPSEHPLAGISLPSCLP